MQERFAGASAVNEARSLVLQSSSAVVYSTVHMASVDRKAITREILLSFWKVHILHHAGEHPVVGHWILTELRRHGYDISPGTLYPLLKRMTESGWLRCQVESGSRGPRARRYYHLTTAGRVVLEIVRAMIQALTFASALARCAMATTGAAAVAPASHSDLADDFDAASQAPHVTAPHTSEGKRTRNQRASRSGGAA
ncbi:MAG: PadR family transcriptional regulator [Acidobacteriota bacterium]